MIASDFLEASATEFAAPYLADVFELATDRAGTVVGRYRLIREIGRGGMGSVWLAERADGQFEQRVALKLIRRGLASDEIHARFLGERQILARLEHPNIGRLLDGGISDHGRPYFVMEHVAGLPITDYCDVHRLGIDDRLKLFMVTCRAIQYAHRGLVVHRDIKPSNVLVTEQGEVKLLDFGVAKLLSATDERAERRFMTPEYASPEQRAGAPVTTTSDVYQLGVLLYQILIGRRPTARAASAAPSEEPTRPSIAVGRTAQVVRRDGSIATIEPHDVAERRRTTSRRLRRRLRGDLDSIVLTALETSPERRHASAEAFAEDIERYLAHRPIRSARVSWSSRASKYMYRHHVAAIANAAIIITSIIVGTSYVDEIRMARDQAEREAAKASEIAGLVARFFQGWSPDAADRGQVSTEKVLGGAVLRARQELGRQPELLAATLSMIGDLYGALGRTSTSDSLNSEALAMQEHLFPHASSDRASTLSRRGHLLSIMGRAAEAETTLRRAIAEYASVTPPTQEELVRVQADLAKSLLDQGRASAAESLLREALQHLASPDSPLATEISVQLGYVLFEQARYAEATAILRPALARQRTFFGAFHPATVVAMRSLASSLRGPRSLPEAESLDREALTIARSLYGESHIETYSVRMALAVLLERKGDFSDAAQQVRAAVAQTSNLFGPTSVRAAQARRTLGSVLLGAGRLEEAEVVLRESIAEFHRAAPAGNLDEGDALNRLAYITTVKARPDADEVYRRAVAFEGARSSKDPYFVTDGYEYLGLAALQRRDVALAEKLFRRAITLYDAELPDGHPYRAQSHRGLADALAHGNLGR
jgi:serine/threonine-protein kinase